MPLFVMVSGALLLTSDRADAVSSFYRRRLWRIGWPLVVWTVVYLVVGHLRRDHPANFAEARYLVLAGIPYFHMYFVYLIAGLYLVAPFLRPLTRQSDDRLVLTAAAVFLGIGMVDLLIKVWGGIGAVNAVTRFLPYVGYFLAGAALVKVSATRTRLTAAVLTVVLGIAVTAIGTALLTSTLGLGRGRYLYEYLSVTTVPITLAIFLLLRWSDVSMRRAGPAVLKGLSRIAALTFGIYLVHPLMLIVLREVGIYSRAFFVPLAVGATVIAAFAMSGVVVAVLQRLPAVRRVV